MKYVFLHVVAEINCWLDHLDHEVRKPDFVACKQYDQRLCCSLSGNTNS